MTINPKKVYLVYAQDNIEYPDGSWVVKTFGTEEEAKHYVDIYNQLEDDDTAGYRYYYQEKELDSFDLNTKIANYYCYSADVEWDLAEKIRNMTWLPESDRLNLSDGRLEEKYNHPDHARVNDDEIYTKIDRGETYIDISTFGDQLCPIEHITVYSKNSFLEAKRICLDLWNEKIIPVKEREKNHK